jgi:hypothetical protein
MRDAEFVDLKMRRETRLVIFEYLARSRDEWSKTGKARTTILIALLFSASQIRAKELHFGGSKAKLRGLCRTSLTRITKN